MKLDDVQVDQALAIIVERNALRAQVLDLQHALTAAERARDHAEALARAPFEAGRKAGLEEAAVAVADHSKWYDFDDRAHVPAVWAERVVRALAKRAAGEGG